MLSAGVFAVDGTYVYSDEPSNWNSGGRWWQYGRSPSDGGVATFLAGNASMPITQNAAAGLRLGGIVATNSLSASRTARGASFWPWTAR